MICPLTDYSCRQVKCGRRLTGQEKAKDVTSSRTRERTLGNNLSWLRRFAVTPLKRHPAKDSIRGKMLRCAYSADFLAEVLEIQGV